MGATVDIPTYSHKINDLSVVYSMTFPVILAQSPSCAKQLQTSQIRLQPWNGTSLERLSAVNAFSWNLETM